jgi:hypothetical protein
MNQIRQVCRADVMVWAVVVLMSARAALLLVDLLS